MCAMATPRPGGQCWDARYVRDPKWHRAYEIAPAYVAIAVSNRVKRMRNGNLN